MAVFFNEVHSYVIIISRHGTATLHFTDDVNYNCKWSRACHWDKIIESQLIHVLTKVQISCCIINERRMAPLLAVAISFLSVRPTLCLSDRHTLGRVRHRKQFNTRTYDFHRIRQIQVSCDQNSWSWVQMKAQKMEYLLSKLKLGNVAR